MAKSKRIHLPNRYRDTNGLRVEAGEYDINDEALRGKGQYLVETRHAFVIDEPLLAQSEDAYEQPEVAEVAQEEPQEEPQEEAPEGEPELIEELDEAANEPDSEEEIEEESKPRRRSRSK